MIISVDFDGTICEHKYPSIGRPNLSLIQKLLEAKEKGHKIILNTCRDGKELNEAVYWCLHNFGLLFDSINEDLEEIKESFINKSNKVYADIYLDDRNISFKDFEELKL